MIAKLRICESGVMRGEDRGATPPDQRNGFASQIGERDAERLRRRYEAVIVTGQFHRVALRPQEIQGRKMQPVQRPNGDGEWFEGSQEDMRRKLNQFDS